MLNFSEICNFFQKKQKKKTKNRKKAKTKKKPRENRFRNEGSQNHPGTLQKITISVARTLRWAGPFYYGVLDCLTICRKMQQIRNSVRSGSSIKQTTPDWADPLLRVETGKNSPKKEWRCEGSNPVTPAADRSSLATRPDKFQHLTKKHGVQELSIGVQFTVANRSFSYYFFFFFLLAFISF